MSQQNIIDDNFEKLHSLYITLIQLEFFGDYQRCLVKDAVSRAFLTASLDDDLYPDEIYAFLESDFDKNKLNDVFREAIWNALKTCF